MFYVYFIQSKLTQEIYIGFTPDLKERLIKHNNNKIFSTKNSGPWNLIYYEAYLSKEDALEREKRLKYYGRALGQLKRRISRSLKK